MYDEHPDIPAPHVGDWAAEFNQKVADTNAPRTCRSEDETRRGRAGYYGNITFIDHQIGRFLYEFKKRDPQAWAETLVVFTSDHGDMMGDHHHWRKTYAYEGSARVPLLMRYPQSWDLPRNTRLEGPVELRDIMPTLLDAAGVEIPESVDGESLLKLARDGREGWRDFVQGEHTTCYTFEHGMQYITDGLEKYIWFHHTGEEQFFDLREDPGECCDLAGDPAQAERVARWRRRLAEVNEQRGDPRGQGGQLVPQPEGALRLSPYYERWQERAQGTEQDGGA
jgi:arylsulfatase A-like enzyme